MKSISGKKLIKVLEKKGWKLARISESHHIYIKQGSKIRLSIPVHKNRDLKMGLLKHFLQVAGLDEKDL